MIAPDFAPLDQVGAVLCGDDIVSIHVVRGPLGNDRSIHLPADQAIDTARRILDVTGTGFAGTGALVGHALIAVSSFGAGIFATLITKGLFT